MSARIGIPMSYRGMWRPLRIQPPMGPFVESPPISGQQEFRVTELSNLQIDTEVPIDNFFELNVTNFEASSVLFLDSCNPHL